MTALSLPVDRDRFLWSCPPAWWSLGDTLQMTTEPDTDYWQRTHYGFARDNGHFFFMNVRGNFTISARLDWTPNAQYDQCGLLIRADAQTWAKCSVEYETAEHSRLGSVVTNLGYSDWATQDLAGSITQRWYRVRRQGDDLLIDWAEDGAAWVQMRIAHLHACPTELQVGIYACSPTGPGFRCQASEVRIDLRQT